MSKLSLVATVLLTLVCYSKPVAAQNISSARQSGVSLADNSSSESHKSESPTKNRIVSPEASAEARRLYKQGVKYGLSGLFKQATELFERAVTLDPNFADAHFGLGHAYFDQGRWEDAIISLENGIRINPETKTVALCSTKRTCWQAGKRGRVRARTRRRPQQF